MTPRGAVLSLLFTVGPEAIPDPLLAKPLRGRECVTCADPAEDLDGDGKADLACVTRKDSEERQRLTVVLSSSPSQLALDVPAVRCPECGGALGLNVKVSIASVRRTEGSAEKDIESKLIELKEEGGSREAWTHTYRFAWDDLTGVFYRPSFPLRSLDPAQGPRVVASGKKGSSHRKRVLKLWDESYEVHDRMSDGPPLVEIQTDYRPERVSTYRSIRSSEETHEASSDEIFVIPEEGPLPGPTSEEFRPFTRETWHICPAHEDATFGLPRVLGCDDFNFSVRARSRGETVFLEVDVRDDDIRFWSWSARDAEGRPGDRIEFWWDEKVAYWSDGDVQLIPDPTTTRGVMASILPSGGVAFSSVFPAGRPVDSLEGSWKRSPLGYVLTLRFERQLVQPGPIDDKPMGAFDAPGTLARATLIVHNVYDADDVVGRLHTPFGEKSLATSSFRREGAPFELGWIHFPPLPRGKQRPAP